MNEWQLSIIPLKQGEKKPAIEWQEYQHRQPAPEEIEKWNFKNLGIVTGTVSKLVVFDADTPEAIEFLEQFKPFKETVQVINRKGKHYYFTTPDLPTDFGCQKVYKENVRIDIKVNGGYVVAPPSVVEDHEYTWINDSSGYGRPFKILSFYELQGLIKQIKQKLGIQNNEEEKAKAIQQTQRIDFEKLKDIILQKYEKGHRQDICMYLAGMLRKAGVDEVTTTDFVIDLVEKANDEERKMRLAAVKKSYEKNEKNLKGISGLIELGYPEGEIIACFDDETAIEIEDRPKRAPLIEEIAEVIKKKYKIDYDEFFVEFFVHDYELTEEQEVDIHVYTERYFDKKIPRETVQQAISYCAYMNKKDRLKEYLEYCRKQWNGENRLESFFYHAFGVPENEYTASVAKNFFIAAVARAFNPGCFLKNILVIQDLRTF